MRFKRLGLAVCALLLAIAAWSKQPSQSASTTQPVSDPQAVAVVQAAITALGGATAIAQSQVWEFHGALEGPMESGIRTETIKLQIQNSSITINGITRTAPTFLNPSLFLPVLAGAVLLQESQDPTYELHLDSPSILAGKPVTVVKLVLRDSQLLAQVWVFDTTTNMPIRIFFELPAQMAQTKSFRGLVDLSNYRSISGVQYPFTVVNYTADKLPETLTLQSLTPSIAALSALVGAMKVSAQ
jgi:hypothetical protein